MRNSCSSERNFNKVLLRILDTLTDSVRNFARLTDTEAYCSVAVADNYESSKLEDTTTLNCLRNTVDSNNAFRKLHSRCINLSQK